MGTSNSASQKQQPQEPIAHFIARQAFARLTKNRPANWPAASTVREWHGIKLLDDDANSKSSSSSSSVTEIVARNTNMEGELGWLHLMELKTLQVLDLHGHNLGGVIVTTDKLRWLPLVTLDLLRSDCSGAPISGEFDLTHLPASASYLSLRNNALTIKNWSSVANLPALTLLSLAANDLSTAGDIDFSLLPRGLQKLSLCNCKFPEHTTVDVAALPSGITSLYLNDTVNLTLHCSDISKFAQLHQLDDDSKAKFGRLQVVVVVELGGKGAASNDAAAPAVVVTGKQLLNMAAPVAVALRAAALRIAAAERRMADLTEAAAQQTPPDASTPVPPPQQRQPSRRERDEDDSDVDSDEMCK